MKKLVLMLVLVLAVFAPAVAQDVPLSDLTTLAGKVNGTAVFFAAIRIDDTYLTTLDNLLGGALQSVSPQPIPRLNTLLDLAVGSLTDNEQTFAEDVRPFLGATAAVILPRVDFSGGQPAVAVEIADRAAAETFLDGLFAEDIDSGVTTRDDSLTGVTQYRHESGDILTLFDDYLTYERPQGISATFASTNTLAENAGFQAAVSALPEDNYNILAYADPARALRPFVNLLGASAAQSLPNVNFEALPDAFGPFAAGATILDQRVLTIDIAQTPGSEDLFAALNLPAPAGVTFDPADPGFARVAPADTVFYLQTTGAGRQAAALFEGLPPLYDAFIAQVVLPNLDTGEEDARLLLTVFSGDRLKTFVELAVEGTIGVPLADVYSGLDGNSATFMALIEDDGRFGLANVSISENTNAEINAQVFDGIVSLMDDFRFPFTVDGTTMTLPISSVQSLSLTPDSLLFPGSTIFAVTDELIYTVPEQLAGFAENPSSLAGEPAFVQAEKSFLPEAEAIWFVHFAPLSNLLSNEAFLAQLPLSPSDRDGIAQVRDVIDLFESAAITTVNSDAAAVTRLTLSLTAR